MSPRVTPRLWMAIPAVVVTLALSIVIGPMIASAIAPKGDFVALGLIIIGFVLAVTLPVLALLGWLRPVFLEQRRVRGTLPTVLAFGPVLYIVYCIVSSKWDNIPIEGALVAIMFAAIAGIGEELAFRGVAVITLRARLSEVWVAVIPSVIFGLTHLTNLGRSGLATSEVLYQVFYAVLFGFSAYALRRVTGGLFIPILIHTLNNGFENILDSSGGGPIAILVDGAALPDIIFIGGLLLGTVAMILIVRDKTNDPGPLLAAPRIR